MLTWVLDTKFAEISGYTLDAIRTKCKRGIWLKGKVWRKAGGRLHINTQEYERWVATDGSLAVASATRATAQ
jgi:hypothetical protein